MCKRSKMLGFYAALPFLLTRPSFGQGAPRASTSAPAPSVPAGSDDDLELPAKATNAPPTPPAAPAPPPVVAAPAAAPATRPEPAASGANNTTHSASSAGVAPTATTGTPIGRTDTSDTKRLPLDLRVSGYIQGQFETNQASEDQLQQGGAPLNQNRFTVRRARVRLDRDWQYARGTVELDANTTRGVSVGIRRAEASLLYRGDHGVSEPPLVMLTIGVMDIPFGYELLELTRERPFMERTTGGLALFPTDQDAGIRLAGALDFFHYAVAVMNGEPVDNSGFPRDPNAAKDVIGRFGADVKPSDGFYVGGGASFATGKGFHAGQDAGKNQLVWRDADQNGAFSPNEVVLVPASGATPSKNFERWALGLDLELALDTRFGRTKLYGEGFVAQNYDRGALPADPVTTGVDVREAGAFGALVQDVTRYGLVGFRGSVYNPNADLAETRRGRLLPFSQTIVTLSPLAGLVLSGSAKLLFQYDFVIDKLARDSRGVPADAKNNVATLRLQVQL